VTHLAFLVRPCANYFTHHCLDVYKIDLEHLHVVDSGYHEGTILFAHRLGGRRTIPRPYTPLTRTHQVWLSDEVPGGILKDVRSPKEGEKVISESTLEIAGKFPTTTHPSIGPLADETSAR
jgi:hypothetical protein